MTENQTPVDPDVAALDRLVGTWRVTGGAVGTVTYRWLEGGRFLLQDVALESENGGTHGIEVIGRLRPFMGEPSADVCSRYYGASGESYDYVYEIDGDTLTIWAGERGSPAYYRGTFDESGEVQYGAWVYPGGGGYESRMERLAIS